MKQKVTTEPTYFSSIAEFAENHIQDREKPILSYPLDPTSILENCVSELPEQGLSASHSIEAFRKSVEPGLIHSNHPCYFGFVIGGATPVSVAADWLASLYDQSAFVYNSSPASAVIEDVVEKWVLDLLGLPKEAAVGFVTGAQMANFTGITVGKNVQLQKRGWDVDQKGLQGAPMVHVFCGACCHGTILSAIRMMGLGLGNIHPVKADDQGRMIPGELSVLMNQFEGPKIICAQAGNVNTGAFDDLQQIADIRDAHDAWLHVDGAFGLWAAVSPEKQRFLKGKDLADSWATDAHKWLNVPQESGLAIIKDREAYQNLKTQRCSYAGEEDTTRRDPTSYTPENTRRSRVFPLYASMLNLGRNGITEMIERACACASLFAVELSKIENVEIVNDVVLNQVLFRVKTQNLEESDKLNAKTAEYIQQSQQCWMGTSVWAGNTVIRISVSNYMTQPSDIKLSIEIIRRAILKARAEMGI